MKAIVRRLHRLESVFATIAKGSAIAEEIIERRRRRLEANGQLVEYSLPIDFTGCRTIADRILRSRQACMKRQDRARNIEVPLDASSSHSGR